MATCTNHLFTGWFFVEVRVFLKANRAPTIASIDQVAHTNATNQSQFWSGAIRQNTS
ncbi:MAG: hypothetical protein RR277_05625 [Rikenellaceae bacterium]